jgi:hypothetical protein
MELKTNLGNVTCVRSYIGKALIGEILKKLSVVSFELPARNIKAES